MGSHSHPTQVNAPSLESLNLRCMIILLPTLMEEGDRQTFYNLTYNIKNESNNRVHSDSFQGLK